MILTAQVAQLPEEEPAIRTAVQSLAACRQVQRTTAQSLLDHLRVSPSSANFSFPSEDACGHRARGRDRGAQGARAEAGEGQAVSSSWSWENRQFPSWFRHLDVGFLPAQENHSIMQLKASSLHVQELPKKDKPTQMYTVSRASSQPLQF